MAINVTFNGTTYSVPEAREVGWSALTNYLVDLANAQVSGGPQSGNLRTAVTSPVTVSATTDYTVVTDLTVAGPVAVDLPVGVDELLILVVDGKGDASTNNVTITPNGAETINGDATYVIEENNEAVMLQYNASASKWIVLANFSVGDVTRTSIDQGANRLQNKDLSDDNVRFVDESDTTKILDFSLAAQATTTSTTIASNSTVDRTINLPDADDTLTGRATTDTLSNKTLDNSSVINVQDVNLSIQDDGDATKIAKFNASAIDTATTRTYNLPNADTSLVGNDNAETLSNKDLDNTNSATFQDTNLTVQDNSDNTKQINLDISNVDTGTTRTLGVPNADTTLLGSDSTQVVTNKDVDGGTASDTSRITIPKDTLTNLQALTRKEGTVVYATDFDRIYYDDGTDLVEVGSGSGGGSGGIDYVTNGDFETDTEGWATYADAAGSSPVDGTGGAPSVTFSRISSTLLRGEAYGQLVKDAADRQGEGVSFDFTIDSVDKEKALDLSFDYNFSVNGATGDIAVFVYDVTNAALISTASSVVPKGGSTNTFNTTFISSDSTSYRLIFHIASTSALAVNFNVDNVKIGPQEFIQTTPQTDWEVSTASSSWSGAGTENVYQRRVGNNLELFYSINMAGAAPTNWVLDLPAGLTIDSTLTPNSTFNPWGSGYSNDDSASSRQPVFVLQNSSTSFFAIEDAGGLNVTVPFTWAANDDLSLQIKVPIAEWAGSSVGLANSRVEFAFNDSGITAAGATDTTSFAYGPAGAEIGSINSTTGNSFTTFRIRFLSEIQPTDSIVIQVQENGTWIEHEARGLTYLRQSTGRYGIRVEPVSGSTTDLDVRFANNGYEAANATYGNNGSGWSGISTVRWRAVKSSNPLSVGEEYRKDVLRLSDGVSAPATESQTSLIHVDSSDGDLKIKFSDGTVKTIVTDT